MRLIGLVVLLTVGLVLAPLAAEAQPQAGKVHRIVFLRDGQPPQSYLEAFQQGLRERGSARAES